MKGVLIILDGVGDLPHNQLDGKTPLQIANKPNLDFLGSHSKLGYMYVIGEKIVPGSDEAVLYILGNKGIKDSRGQLEAIGAGLKLMRGDLAIRTNFATVSKNRHVVDRRAGRTLTTEEANQLAKAINSKVKLSCKFEFKNTIQHRGVLVLRGAFSDNITNTDPEYRGKRRYILKPQFKFSEPLDDEENSKHAANMINRFIEQSNKILANHPINIDRKKKGLYPANIILTRGAGSESLHLKKFIKWGAVVNMPLEIGIMRFSGIDVFDFAYPKLKKNDVYNVLYKNLKLTCKYAVKYLKKNWKKYDYFYIHFKETDVPGHDNRPLEKIKMIEMIDKRFFSKMKKRFMNNKIKIVVTADHSTPCKLKAHSYDPVPVMFCDWQSKGEKFDEENCRKGELGKIYGIDLLKKVGFVK